MNLHHLLRQRVRDWRTSLSFVTVIGVAVAVGGTWLAVAYPLLRGMLPFRDAERIVAVESWKKGERGGVTWADMEDLRTDSVGEMAGYAARTWGLQTEPGGHVEVVLSLQVTGEFFRTLGVDVAHGAGMTREHELAGNQKWVWLSHQAWGSVFGGADEVTNRTVWINAVPYRVAGVLPASFAFPHQGKNPDIYIPLPRSEYWGARGVGGLGVLARLKSADLAGRFQTELEIRSRVLAERHPATNAAVQYSGREVSAFLLGERWELLQWLLVSVLILLSVALTNAGGIWLSQLLRQQRQISIQLALGASLWRVWTEQMVQVAVLGLAGAAVGLAGSAGLLAALRATPLLGQQLALFELWGKAGLNPGIAGWMVATALVTSLGSGLLPLLMTRRPLAPQAGALTATNRSAQRLRMALTVAQLVLTGSLAYGGFAIGRAVLALVQPDRGFQTEQIFVSGIGISEAKYNTDEKMIGFHEQVIRELQRVPGVTAAGGGLNLPVGRMRTRFLLHGEQTPKDQQRMAAIGVASPGALAVLGIPVRRGRGFGDSDRYTTARVALVNQAFADRYLAEAGDAVGQRIRFSFYNGFQTKPYAEHEIVGVVQNTLNRELSVETEPQIFLSSTQMAFEGFQYFVRSTLPAEALAGPVREAVWKVDPALEKVGVTPLGKRVDAPTENLRLLTWLLALFGGISAVVVGFGLASSLAATFVAMRRELGIRAALGASPLRLAGDSVRWVGVALAMSCVVTLPISIYVGRVVMIGRTPMGWDGGSWVGAAMAMGLIGVVTAYFPARRAARMDPVSTLRAE